MATDHAAGHVPTAANGLHVTESVAAKQQAATRSRPGSDERNNEPHRANR